MRADIKALLIQLSGLYRKKLQLLKKIETEKAQFRHGLVSDNAPLTEDSFENTELFIEDIDSLDYDISFIREKICRTAGIAPENFDNFCSERKDHDECVQLLTLQQEEKSQIDILTRQNQEIMSLLEEEKEKTEIHIRDMNNIIRLKKVLNKKPAKP